MSKNQKTQQTNTAQKATKAQKPKEHKQQPLNAAQLRSAPETIRSEDVLKAQKTLGNETVQRSLGTAQHDLGATDGQGYLKTEISDAIQKKRGSGNALPSSVKEEAKQKLGHDFDDVRIHTDAGADQISSKINAKAFTIGKDIFFKKDAYAPGSEKGRETLLHEMTHVAQQSGSAPAQGKLKLGAPDTAHEKEAESLSKKNTGTKAEVAGKASGTTVQRFIGKLFDIDKLKKKTESKPQMSYSLSAMEDQTIPDAPPIKDYEDHQKNKNIPKAPDAKGLDNFKQSEIVPKAPEMPKNLIGSHRKQVAPEYSEMSNALKAKRKEIGIGSDENKDKLAYLDQRKEQRNMKSDYMQGKGSKDLNKYKLINTIQNKNSSNEEVTQAKQQLDDLYGSKTNDFLKIFAQDRNSKLTGQRRSNLKNAAALGEEGAYEKYKEFQKANPTRWQSVKNFASDTGSSIGNFFKDTFTKDNLSKGFNAVKGLFGGGNKKEEAAPTQQQGMMMPMGGMGMMGGGGGMSTIMQEYARVLEENKQLKEKLKEKGE